ncbi:hypothetical protein SELMODRAFT_403788 [Selaginella moellendorffii]|uniref:Uncharacterized protein n=1 Tax=Selaginella moellendorffii TaxID=88036 RepID=D8QSJ2_SELML|nr:hypothetical protein SELMODRAFT_403788 [Selaginella moellendorffii]
MPPGRSASHTPSQSRARAGRSTTSSLRRFNCFESRGWVLPLRFWNYVLSKLDELMANAATTEWEDQEETLARLTHHASLARLRQIHDSLSSSLVRIEWKSTNVLPGVLQMLEELMIPCRRE